MIDARNQISISDLLLYEGMDRTIEIGKAVYFFNTEHLSNENYIARAETQNIIITPRKKENQSIKAFEDVLVIIENNLGYEPSNIYSYGLMRWLKFDIKILEEYYNKGDFILISFSPKFPQEITGTYNSNTKNRETFAELYHLTFKKHESKIKKIGLVPKTKNRIERHSSKIHLFYDKNDLYALLNVFKKMYPMEKFIIVTINYKNIKNNIRFFVDSKTRGGIFTLQNIAPTAIKTIEDIQTSWNL